MEKSEHSLFRRLSAPNFLALQTPKAQNIEIEGKSVQLVWICFECCFSRKTIFIARLCKFDFLELLSKCCIGFMGAYDSSMS